MCVQYWKCGDEITTVLVPEFSIDFSEILFPILAGYNDDSEHSIICIYTILRKFADFVSNALKYRHAVSCHELPFDTVCRLNQISRIFLDYLKNIGVDKYLPDVERCGYFPLKPTECIPFCQYVYESVCDKVFDIKEYLDNKGLTEVEDDFTENDLWE